jgi:hypothetical protein
MDSSNNAYVTGYSWGDETYSDYVTIKYDSKGNQHWIDRYNGPGNGEDVALDIALDSPGSVYVTGWSTGSGTEADCATIKYDDKGKRLWVTRYNGPANGYDMAYDMALDFSGNVYITGWSQGVGSDADYLTIKYDSNGNQIWVARYNGPASGEDKASALAIDGSGNVYVTGASEGNGTAADYTTVKYDALGNLLWVARYNGPANGEDMASGIAIDSSYNIYITGSSVGNNTDADYATVKYNSSGSQIWVARYNGPANGEDGASAIAWASPGYIYVTGSSEGNNSDADYATVKYDSSGSQIWAARYNGPANGEDRASAIVLDSSGNIYVTGWSTGERLRYDYATVKYDGDGKELWLLRFDGPAHGHDKAYALALNTAGSLYVTGRSSGGGTFYDYTTIKYTQ